MEDRSKEAYEFIRKHKKQIVKQFVSLGVKKNETPVFIFMAGAPGAGKTEFSRNLIKILEKKICVNGIVRIDADEIRDIFGAVGYDGKNSDLFKRGCIKGVEILYDHCLKNKLHTILDGTLSSFGIADRNMTAALNIGAVVYIVYVYQDPVVAWGFTKIREREEGRRIERELFVNSLFKSIEVVNALKNKYKEKIEIWLVKKDISHRVEAIKFNIGNLDDYLDISYTINTLKDKLYE